MTALPVRPPLLLIHGAWQGSWVWEAFQPLLADLGWDSHAVDLPGNGCDDTPPEAVNLAAYVDHCAAWVDQQPGPVVVVGHSGGAVVASQLAEARPHKVAALVYLAGIMLPSDVPFGQLVQEVLPQHPEAVGINAYLEWSADRRLSWVPPAAAREIFLHDCPPVVAERASTRFVPQPTDGLIITPHLTDQGWGAIPRLYVEALHDRSVILPLQRRMQALCPGTRRLSLPTGHAPQVAAPTQLANLLGEALPGLLKP
ncbi:alpha/beta fold hydrolase [Azospira inquinata]|uniref:Alpha/beta hydrolase n=1 Tax=Azospira inquinata TaxID=2785627 RepID=A0A975SKU2_9RHOO|nr:alpha/beta hydrolase [Azospira inquinata]QWT46565.1 alpha/beta hydrolase [Azospira inquinata]QWT48113.1 alpha/beta hydrolase [Azospira inquinata]